MRIRVPFQYMARVTQKRHRNSEYQSFYEWTEVEIREVDPADAPVAVRWNDELPAEIEIYREKDDWGTWPEGGQRETRWLDGAHWWDALEPSPIHRHGPSRLLTPARLAEMCESGASDGNPVMRHFMLGNRQPPGPEGHPIREDDYRLVENCSRDAELEAVHASAADLVIADGRLYARGPEPVMRLTSWIVDGPAIQAVIKTGPLDKASDPNTVYRADRFEEAAAAALPHGYGEVRTGFNDIRKPDVLVPESLAYDDERNAFFSSAAKIAGRAANRPISEFTGPAAAAWCALRDALGAGRDDGAAVAVEEALEGYRDAGALTDDRSAEVQAALDRWRSRPIEAAAWTP